MGVDPGNGGETVEEFFIVGAFLVIRSAVEVLGKLIVEGEVVGVNNGVVVVSEARMRFDKFNLFE